MNMIINPVYYANVMTRIYTVRYRAFNFYKQFNRELSFTIELTVSPIDCTTGSFDNYPNVNKFMSTEA
jgi:hypothetical protein